MPYQRTIKSGKTYWEASVMVNGKRRSKRFDTKKEAITWEVETRKAMDHEIHTTSLLTWATEYLEYAEKHSPKVFSEKRGVFRRFFQDVDPEADVETLTPRHALGFLQKQYKERSGCAANKDRKNLVAAWNWGVKFMGLSLPNPFVLVEQFPHDEKGHYVPPEKDFFKVLEVSEGQERVMLLTFLHTAGRRGEIYRLRWEDVDFRNSKIRLKTRKRKGGSLQSDWLPMTNELYQVLLEHRQQAETDWVFVQEGRLKGRPFTENRKFPKELCRKAGVKPFGCHGIRGLTASILAQHDVPMIAISQTLRHTNLRTTERYVRGLEPVRPHLRVLEGRRRT